MHGLFIDWLSVWQFHQEHAPVNSGAITTTNGSGYTVFERFRPSRVQGSHETSCAIKSDGQVVVASGNFGRLNRSDNLFNYDPVQTLQRVNAVADFSGLPLFSLNDQRNGTSKRLSIVGVETSVNYASIQDFCHLSRVDLTRNYRCGSLSAARAAIRAIQGKSISRVKKGIGGDASVWWSNTRYMLKVYIKSLEMEAHGTNSGQAYEYARDNGIIRLELELKRRELDTLGWSNFDDFVKAWHMGNVHKLFADYEKVLKVEAIPNDADFLDALPQRLRVTAAAFLAGREVRSLVSRATFFRYRKALLEYGLDIADERPAQLSTVVRQVIIEPVAAPDWYWKDKAA